MTRLIHHQLLSLPVYCNTGGLSCSPQFFWNGMQFLLDTHHCTISLAIFLCLVSYFCSGWGAVFTRVSSTLGGEYYFSLNGICYGDVDVSDLALHLVWGVGAAVMVTAFGSTLGVVWVLSRICSTFLV